MKGRDTYAAFLDRLYFDENNGDWIPYGSITQTSSDGTSYNVRGQLEYRGVFGEPIGLLILGEPSYEVIKVTVLMQNVSGMTM